MATEIRPARPDDVDVLHRFVVDLTEAFPGPVTVERGGARSEWWVLRTDDPAPALYARLGNRQVGEIAVRRRDGAALDGLAAVLSGHG